MHAGARAYRDLVGIAHQRLAALADEVYLLVAGLPVALKGGRGSMTGPRRRRGEAPRRPGSRRAARRGRDGRRGRPPRPADEAAREPRPARGGWRSSWRGSPGVPTRPSPPGRSSWPRPTTASRAAASRPIRPRSPPRWSPTSSAGERPSTSSRRTVGARVVVVDVGVAGPIPDVAPDPVRGGTLVSARVRAGTADMTEEPAMTRDEALEAIAHGPQGRRRAPGRCDGTRPARDRRDGDRQHDRRERAVGGLHRRIRWTR